MWWLQWWLPSREQTLPNDDQLAKARNFIAHEWAFFNAHVGCWQRVKICTHHLYILQRCFFCQHFCSTRTFSDYQTITNRFREVTVTLLSKSCERKNWFLALVWFGIGFAKYKRQHRTPSPSETDGFMRSLWLNSARTCEVSTELAQDGGSRWYSAVCVWYVPCAVKGWRTVGYSGTFP